MTPASCIWDTKRMVLDPYAYDAHRPSYPAAAMTMLTNLGALSPQSVVADVGSGTGIFSKVLLDNGCRVFGVEPLVELSEVANVRLADHLRFTNILGSAEETSLDDSSVDLVTAASALHWFDADAARNEFRRILREPGWTAALWNFRMTGDSAFDKAFDRLWRREFGPPPAATRREIECVIAPRFFSNSTFERYAFENPLLCNEDGLVGLAASSSHAPGRDDPKWLEVEQHIRRLHRLHQREGLVQVSYETMMYCGRLL